MIELVRDWFRLAGSARARPILLIALCVDSAFLFVFLVAIQSYLPEQHGGGVSLAGYALAGYGVAKLVAQLFAGRLVDRFGSAKAALIGLLGIALGQATLFTAIAVPNAILPAAVVYGLGGAVLWPALYARAGSCFEQNERARLGAGLTVTAGLSLIIALGLGLALPARFPYAAAIAIALGVVAVAVGLAAGLRSSGSELADADEGPGAGSFRVLIATALDSKRLAFAVFVLLQSAAVGSLQAVFRSYGRDFLGVSFRRELILLAPAALVGAGAVVIGGALADRLGRLRLLSTGFLLTGVAVWLLSGVTSPSEVIPVAALAGLGVGLASPSIRALSMDLSRVGSQGTVLAWFMIMEGLGHAGGAGLGGWLNTTANPENVLRLSAALFLCVGMGAAASLAFVSVTNSRVAVSARGVAPAQPILGTRRSVKRRILAGALVLSLGLFGLGGLAFHWAVTPSSQVYGTIITHGPRQEKLVALTFDDGPNDPWTLRIAGVLDKSDVKATFFIVGKNADAHPDIVRALVQRGHLVGNHSYHHSKRRAIFDLHYGDLNEAQRSIAAAGGVCPAFFRTPYGFHTPWQLHAVSRHHLETIGWDVQPDDWKQHNIDTLVRDVVRSVKPGSIVLLHDGQDTRAVTDRSVTMGALPAIIEGLRSEGYRFVRLDELLAKPPYLKTCDGLRKAGA